MPAQDGFPLLTERARILTVVDSTTRSKVEDAAHIIELRGLSGYEAARLLREHVLGETYRSPFPESWRDL